VPEHIVYYELREDAVYVHRILHRKMDVSNLTA